MILYDKPGEVRVTADHAPVATIEGRVTLELTSPGHVSVAFHPSKKRLARKGWHWYSPFSTDKFVRATIYTAGEQVGPFSGDEEGWWVPPNGSIALSF